MSFFSLLREQLDTPQIFDGLKGKYEARFKVNGAEYAFIANTIAGDTYDNSPWEIEFENIVSHRIGNGDTDPQIAKSFAEIVKLWIEDKNPISFYTYGSSLDSIKNIINAVKKVAKKYNVVDETEDTKDQTGAVIEGNPVGRVMFNKFEETEAVDSEEKNETKSDKFEQPYEDVKDVKANKDFMSGTSKSDKLDKNDKSYDFKLESFKDFVNKKLNEEFDEEEPDAEIDEPNYDEDCFIEDVVRGGYSVSCSGKNIGKFVEYDDAVKAIKDWQAKNDFYPNVWFVNDHGNVDLVTI